MLPTSSILIVLCSLPLLGLVCVRYVPEGHAYTLRRIGGRMRSLGAGIHLVLPLIERVAHKIRLLGNEVEIKAHVPSGDLHGRVYFQVIEPLRADSMIDGIPELLRQRIPELTLDTCNENDPAARDRHLKAELNRDLNDCGVLITRVQLR